MSFKKLGQTSSTSIQKFFSPKKTNKETSEVTQETSKETFKETSKGTPKKTRKEIPEETFKGTPIKTLKESPKGTSLEMPKKTPKETVKKSYKGTPKEIPKGTPKMTPKETLKKTQETAVTDSVAVCFVDSSTKKKFTFFWKKDSPFSQHHTSNFAVNGVRYNCAEQFMMHQKALLFNDHESAKQIMKTQSPVAQKRYGRKVKPFDPRLWDSKCVSVVKEGNMAKFKQNLHLMKKLFETAGTTLVEASPFDRKWGIGMAETNPAATDRSKWRGKNLLGEILTELREELLISESVSNLEEW